MNWINIVGALLMFISVVLLVAYGLYNLAVVLFASQVVNVLIVTFVVGFLITMATEKENEDE